MKRWWRAYKRWQYRKWKVPPLEGYPCWSARKSMLRHGARLKTCGWCGNEIPMYPKGGGTIVSEDGLSATLLPLNGTCIACGRDPYEYYSDWFYRAEYSDGCVDMKGLSDSHSHGKHHAPHLAFHPNDIPVRVWEREITKGEKGT